MKIFLVLILPLVFFASHGSSQTLSLRGVHDAGDGTENKVSNEQPAVSVAEKVSPRVEFEGSHHLTELLVLRAFSKKPLVSEGTMDAGKATSAKRVIKEWLPQEGYPNNRVRIR